MDISDRKRQILSQIVALHTMSGDPVGSRLLQEFLQSVSVSTATLRNEMAQLTALGLLEQPHTSAGRVPTVSGYRYYLDYLMPQQDISEQEKRQIEKVVSEMDSDPDKAAQAAASAIAQMSGLGAVAATPVCADTQMIHYELSRAGRYNVAVLGITNLGALKSRVCRISAEMTDAALQQVSDIINKALCFRSHADVSERLLSDIKAALGEENKAADAVVNAAAALLSQADEVAVYRAGQANLLKFPEVEGHAEELIRLFESEKGLAKVLSRDKGIECFVGEELGDGYEALSLIVGRYRTPGGGHGGLAVVGPVRMNYEMIIPRLRYFCSCMSEALAAR